MSRIERIMQFVDEQHKAAISSGMSPGVTAKFVSEELGIWRNDASKDLNILVNKGLLVKSGSRPVIFKLNTVGNSKKLTHELNEEETFKSIIGYNGSLRLQIQLAKSAAAYPPCGIHTLIIGNTGVGKTLLAETIWNYFSWIRPKKKVPFIIFNCAEYYDNPQLLLSQLFGYEKGAFTGADSSKEGLIEKANGGVLLLDEIHRLPLTGQEMFFTVIDKGVYRRLGGAEDKHVELMIIGATTEDINSNLLNTFKRRIPMVIQIPDLDQRPPVEKLNLIIQFILDEAKKLNMPIRVSREALKYMLSYKSEANVGDLKNQIQICCANSYHNYISKIRFTEKDKNIVDIDLRDLSRKLLACNYNNNINIFLDTIDIDKYYMIYPSEDENSIYCDNESYVNNKNLLNNDTEKGVKINLQRLRNIDLQECYKKDITNIEEIIPENYLYALISSDSWEMAKEIIHLATIELGNIYSGSAIAFVALYLEQIKSYAKAGKTLIRESNYNTNNAKDKEAEFIKSISQQISNKLSVQILDNEINILAMVLKECSADNSFEESKVVNRCGLIVACNGDHESSTICSIVNKMLNSNVAQAFNIPSDRDENEILSQICTLIDKNNHGNDVILITNSDKLLKLKKRIFKRTKTRCRLISKLDLMVVLETAKAILIAKDNTEMDRIIKNIEQISFYGRFLSPYSKDGYKKVKYI